MSILYPAVFLILALLCVYYAFKEGLTKGAERAIEELENEGLIEVDQEGNISPVKWEYVYPDRKDNEEQ